MILNGVAENAQDRDATTFKIVPALNGQAGSVSFELTNKPGVYLRQSLVDAFARDRIYRLAAERSDGSDSYKTVQINETVAFCSARFGPVRFCLVLFCFAPISFCLFVFAGGRGGIT